MLAQANLAGTGLADVNVAPRQDLGPAIFMDDDCVRQDRSYAPPAASAASSSSATMLVILIIGLTAGPAVSL